MESPSKQAKRPRIAIKQHQQKKTPVFRGFHHGKRQAMFLRLFLVIRFRLPCCRLPFRLHLTRSKTVTSFQYL